MQSFLIAAITFAYVSLGAVRVLSYVPQIWAVSKERSEAKAISLITWTFWTLANLTTGLYATVVVPDMLLALMSYGNTLGCAIVVGIVMYKRKVYGMQVDKSKDFVLAQDEDVMNIFAK